MSPDLPEIVVKFDRSPGPGKSIRFPEYEEWKHLIPELSLPDPVELLYATLRKIAAGCAEKSVEELTGEEKLAIFHVAGVPLRVVPGEKLDGPIVIETAIRCGIIKVDGKFIVGREP